jgi:PEP-CTERM motif
MEDQMKRKAYLLATAVAASVGFAAGAQAQSSIVSVQFPQYYGGPVNPLNVINFNGTTNADINHSAGVEYVNNWNVVNVNGGSYTTVTNANLIDGNGNPRDTDPSSPEYQKLVDSTDTPTNISFSFSYNSNDHTTNSFIYSNANDQVTGSNADQWLANGAAFTTDTVNNPVSLTLSNLDPGATYSLIAYVASPWWASGSGAPEGTFTMNGASFYDKPGVLSNSTWLRGASTNPSAPSKGNYVEFDNLTGSAAQTLTVSGNYIGLSGFQLISPGITAPPPAPPMWVTNGSGDWNGDGNWSDAIPNGVDKEADFLGAISSNHTVYTDSNVTVGTLVFDNPNTYVITGSANLTLSATSATPGGASIQVKNTAAASNVVDKISLPLELASNTTFNVASGATLKISNPMTIDSGVSLTTTGAGSVLYESTITLQSGATMAVANSTHAASLTLQGASTASVVNSSTVLQVDSLAMSAGSTLDVGTGALAITNGSLAAVNASVASSFNGTTWSSTGITSSAVQNDPTSLHALGVAQIGGNVEVKYTYYGDADLSGAVDGNDYSIIDSNNGKTSGALWSQGDFNYDGKVDGSDYSLIDNAFNQQSAVPSALIAANTSEVAGATSAVPEPGTLGMLTIATAGLLNRRRRND